jgi:hypothetical protein
MLGWNKHTGATTNDKHIFVPSELASGREVDMLP